MSVLSGRGLCDRLVTRPLESFECGVSNWAVKNLHKISK